MVHVEIFLGGETGKETIAARDKYSVVEVFDTYEFTSEIYYDIKYHFRSIDTWLRGIHKYAKMINYRSFCIDHKWHEEFLDKKNKYSIFNLDKEVRIK